MRELSHLKISQLRHRPEFVADVADRIWHAWWRDAGVSLEELSALVRESLGGDVVPSAFVATCNGCFAGTASLIAQDMEERPNYSPWIAAVWVEPGYRGAGVATQLVRHAANYAFMSGIPRLYLYCDPSKGPLYAKMGWTRIERNVGGNDIFALDA